MVKQYDPVLSKSILRFLLAGAASTGLDCAVYMLLSLRLSVTVSKGASMVVASIFSYVVSKIFTFKNKKRTDLRLLLRFYMVFMINFGVNLSVNYAVYNMTAQKPVSFVAATCCGMIVNYFGQRFFVFGSKEDRH